MNRLGISTLILFAAAVSACSDTAGPRTEAPRDLPTIFPVEGEEPVGPDYSVIAFAYYETSEWTACPKTIFVAGQWFRYLKTNHAAQPAGQKYDSLKTDLKTAGSGGGGCGTLYDAGVIWVDMDAPITINGVGHLAAAGFDSLVVVRPPLQRSTFLRPVLQATGACPHPRLMQWTVKDADGVYIENVYTEILERPGTSLGRTYFAEFNCAEHDHGGGGGTAPLSGTAPGKPGN